MSIPLTINSVTYDYPEVSDQGWGPDATDWASAVTSGMLQKAGGLFQLLAEVDFGSSFGVKSLYYKSRTANPSDAGQVRLARADVINWRNQANDNNLSLGVSSSDVLQFNGSDIQSGISVSDTATIDLTFTSNTLSADIKVLSIDDSLVSASAAIAFSKLAALTSAHILVGSAGNVATDVAMSGDITISNAGATAIGANKVTNAQLAQMATLTIKGNNTGGASDPLDLTVAQTTAILNNFVGDSGSGGTKGLVPAPAAGDAAALKFLKADGTWAAPAGAGDVVGPGSATDNGFVRFDGTTGKLIKNSAATITNADVVAAAAIAVNKLAALTASRAVVSDASGFITQATTTSTEIGYVNGVTSAIQTQINTKLPTTITTTGDIIYSSSGTTASPLAIGSAGQYLGVVSGVPGWKFPVYRSITTTDSPGNVDEYGLCSGASFTLTLPTAIGFSGKTFTFTHGGTSLTQVYTFNTTSAQTIGGIASGSYALYTNGESLTIYSDGANWRIREHVTNTAPVTYTPTITHSSGGMTNATITGVWWRIGKTLVGRGHIVFTGTPASFSRINATIPANMTIDTTPLLATTANGIILGSTALTDANGAVYSGDVRYNSTTTMAVYTNSQSSAGVIVDIAQNVPFTIAINDTIDWSFEVPIVGWQP